jgi:hypothetical protein
MEARAASGFVTEERLLSMLSLFQHNCRNIARQQIKWYRSKDRSEVLSSILVLLNPLPISKSSSHHIISFFLLARRLLRARDRNSVARGRTKALGNSVLEYSLLVFGNCQNWVIPYRNVQDWRIPPSDSVIIFYVFFFMFFSFLSFLQTELCFRQSTTFHCPCLIIFLIIWNFVICGLT